MELWAERKGNKLIVFVIASVSLPQYSKKERVIKRLKYLIQGAVV